MQLSTWSTPIVPGGPMEAGKVIIKGITRLVDLVDAMIAAADDTMADEDLAVIERSACPTCGSCLGMFTANSMNCLIEALGLGLPGNGTVLATHSDHKNLFLEAGRTLVDLAQRYYEQDDASVLPRNIAMGGSTNTSRPIARGGNGPLGRDPHGQCHRQAAKVQRHDRAARLRRPDHQRRPRRSP